MKILDNASRLYLLANELEDDFPGIAAELREIASSLDADIEDDYWRQQLEG